MPDLPVIVQNDTPQSDWKEIVPPALMILGAFSLLRTSRVLALALAGAWAYDFAKSSEVGVRSPRPPRSKARRAEALVDEALDESFPASDPPAYSGASST